MPHIRIRDAHTFIEFRRTFNTYGALSATNYGPDGVSGHNLSTGYLPDAWRRKFRDSIVTYVVCSYATPIGWVTVEGDVVVPDVSYSVTTSKHQGQARWGLGVTLPTLTRTQRSAYSDLQLHGKLWPAGRGRFKVHGTGHPPYERRTLDALVDAGLARWTTDRPGVLPYIELWSTPGSLGGRQTVRASCPTSRRSEMAAPSSDRAAIRQVIHTLRGTGHVLSYVYDGEDEVGVNTPAEALDAIMDVDDAYLHVRLPDGSTGWVRFVMGNEPEEVAADWTVNLSPALDPLTEGWWS